MTDNRSKSLDTFKPSQRHQKIELRTTTHQHDQTVSQNTCSVSSSILDQPSNEGRVRPNVIGQIQLPDTEIPSGIDNYKQVNINN